MAIIVSFQETGLATDRGRVELHSRTVSTSPPLSVHKSAIFPRNWATLKSVAGVEANPI